MLLNNINFKANQIINGHRMSEVSDTLIKSPNKELNNEEFITRPQTSAHVLSDSPVTPLRFDTVTS